MELFSERQGYKSVKTIMQVNTMDTDLRNGLWNALELYYWKRAERTNFLSDSSNKDILLLLRRLWLDYFKRPLDTLPNLWAPSYRVLRDYFLSCQWFEVYDFIQFVANEYYLNAINQVFVEYSNSILERELSGYRFIEGRITPITSKEEIAEIEEALRSKKPLEPVVIHLKSALDLFSDRKSPDYRNSIKESISAVEAICKSITGKNDATLGDALKVISMKIEIHSALQQSFIKLYGYTSDAEGIRHSLLTEPQLDFEDAKFMLVSCSAFINYLKVKSSKAGIHLESK